MQTLVEPCTSSLAKKGGTLPTCGLAKVRLDRLIASLITMENLRFSRLLARPGDWQGPRMRLTRWPGKPATALRWPPQHRTPAAGWLRACGVALVWRAGQGCGIEMGLGAREATTIAGQPMANPRGGAVI